MSWEVRTMKSKKSCFSGALLRRNLSRFWAVWALAAAVMSLYFFATAGRMGISGQSSESFRFPFPGLSRRDWSAWEYEPIINPIPPFLFGMLAAVCVFRYLHQARSAYMLHAFPLTRGTLYRSVPRPHFFLRSCAAALRRCCNSYSFTASPSSVCSSPAERSHPSCSMGF